MSAGKRLFHVFYCPKCKHGYELFIGDPDLNLFGLDSKRLSFDRPHHCPRFELCDGSLQVYSKKTPPTFRPRGIGARDLFTAASGFGFPEERQCSVEQVRKEMVGQKIVNVGLWHGELSTKKRCVIGSITLESGLT